jgi:hypothetical protein
MNTICILIAFQISRAAQGEYVTGPALQHAVISPSSQQDIARIRKLYKNLGPAMGALSRTELSKILSREYIIIDASKRSYKFWDNFDRNREQFWKTYRDKADHFKPAEVLIKGSDATAHVRSYHRYSRRMTSGLQVFRGEGEFKDLWRKRKGKWILVRTISLRQVEMVPSKK